MIHEQMPRRSFLSASAVGFASAALAAEEITATAPMADRRANLPKPGDFPTKVISSANGLAATQKAYELILAGKDPLEAVVEGVSLVEADPQDTSVGYGGLPNEEGVVELDAAVMHGPQHLAGAVAALRNIKHPAQVALQVMKRTDHVLLVGEGALQFARAMGFPEENLLTERARKIWLHWKMNLSDKDDWLAPDAAEVDAETAEFFQSRSVRRRPPGDQAPPVRPSHGNDPLLRHECPRRYLVYDDDQRPGFQDSRRAWGIPPSSEPACTSTMRSGPAAARDVAKPTCRISAALPPSN